MIPLQDAFSHHGVDPNKEEQGNHPCETSDKCVSRCVEHDRVCPCHARAAGRRAHLRQEYIFANSALFADGTPPMKSIDPADVLIGEKLGEGGFSFVNACALKGDPLGEDYAIKYLRREVMLDRRAFAPGAADLVNEALFLSKLDHPNIIKLYGVTEGDVETNLSSVYDAGFFLVLDRLVETLEDRIRRWRQQVKGIPNTLKSRLSGESTSAHKALLKERLEVALKIASTFEYLHGMHIAFRDLKPSNIGFCRDGHMTLFDFGFAREVKPSDANGDGTYKLTGKTGSWRYIAPEVALEKPYNKSVDVFSFGILLWEICAMAKPFADFSAERYMNEVMEGGARLKMDSTNAALWPASVQSLIKRCWSDDPAQRPEFKEAREILEAAVQQLSPKKSGRSSNVSVDGSNILKSDSMTLNSECVTKAASTRRFVLGLNRSRS